MYFTRWWTPNGKTNGYAVLAGCYPKVERFYSYSDNGRTASAVITIRVKTRTCGLFTNQTAKMTNLSTYLKQVMVQNAKQYKQSTKLKDKYLHTYKYSNMPSVTPALVI